MNGRRAVVGFALLCALTYAMAMAPSAWAVKGTTAVTCEPTPNAAEFMDPHCDKGELGGEGTKFGEIKPGKNTEISVSNESTKNETKEPTPAKLATTLQGEAVEVECKEVTSGAGAASVLENNLGENASKEKFMEASGRVEVIYSKCTVLKPAKGCEVAEPITMDARGKSTIINESKENEEMGVFFEPVLKGGNFGEISFKAKAGEKCAQEAKSPFAIKGSITGTPGNAPNGTGVTLYLTPGMSNLTVGGEKATLSSTTTTKMVAGNPIALTTNS